MQDSTVKYVGTVVAALAMNVFLCGSAVADLAARITKIVGSAKQSEYAVHVIEPKSGSVVYSHNANKAMIPASNMKLIATAAAMKYLGPLFEYRTRVLLWGSTLVVVGSGDPLLGDKVTDARYGRPDGWIFADIIRALEDRGVQEINDIVVDTTVFDDQRVHPNWLPRDLNRWFACEVCGLNYNTNCIQVTARNSEGRIVISVEPATSFIEIVNEVQAISSGESAVGAYRSRQPNRIMIRGTCKDRQGPFDVAIEKPAAMFGFLLAEHLLRAGITVQGQLIEGAFDRDGPFVEIAEFTTPLIDCLHRANKDSIGLVAEALLKTIAAENNPDRKNGTWEQGRELIGRYLSDLKVAREEFKIDDGSGLSRENRLSAHAIATVLLDVYRGGNWELFRTSLAVGGEDGTVGRYFKEPQYRANILGKTGYISGVQSLSGVCLTDNGPYFFSILSNRLSLSRDAIHQIAAAIIDEYKKRN
jgi:D-alanyl-D-alanine carboxypeptidase/D-alanyl-D-alanine-endopeptidase (penicillin-binding protein 4)